MQGHMKSTTAVIGTAIRPRLVCSCDRLSNVQSCQHKNTWHSLQPSRSLRNKKRTKGASLIRSLFVKWLEEGKGSRLLTAKTVKGLTPRPKRINEVIAAVRFIQRSRTAPAMSGEHSPSCSRWSTSVERNWSQDAGGGFTGCSTLVANTSLLLQIFVLPCASVRDVSSLLFGWYLGGIKQRSTPSFEICSPKENRVGHAGGA